MVRLACGSFNTVDLASSISPLTSLWSRSVSTSSAVGDSMRSLGASDGGLQGIISGISILGTIKSVSLARADIVTSSGVGHSLCPSLLPHCPLHLCLE